MWAQTLSSQEERTAFTSLLAEYFQRPFPSASASVSASAVPHTHAPVEFHNPSRPAGLTTTAGRTPHSPSSPNPGSPASPSFSTRAQNAVAQHALENPALTNSALRQAGVPAGAAASASKFGAAHSAQLAPHLAKAANAGWANRNAGQTSPPTSPPAAGARGASGLTSSKSMAGGYNTTSGKAFTKSLFTGGGPMARDKVDKPFTGALATHTPVKVPSKPPPRRGVVEAQKAQAHGLGTATALYDYEGAEVEDLPVVEGEVVTVLEHVDESWWKCRNAAGSEGVVPSGYLQAGGA